MAKRTKWKIAVAVLAVVIAGSVYCIFFTEEKDSTVLYQTDEYAENMSVSNTGGNGAQTGSDATQDFATGQNDVAVQSEGTGQGFGISQNNGTAQKDSQNFVYVHVCGAVKNPAVYSLPEGSRVCDAIAKAGGLTESAADDYVNQARFLCDGERVYIPKKDELSNLSASQYAAGQSVYITGNSLGGSSTQTGSPKNVQVNINTAGISELTSLPGIGESRAESIIAYREQHGAFSRIEDIMKINGIKDAAYEKIKDRICTGNE